MRRTAGTTGGNDVAKGTTPTTTTTPNGSAATSAGLKQFEAARKGVDAVVAGLQTIASMGGQPAAAVAAFGGQMSKLTNTFIGAAPAQFVSVMSQLPQLFKSAADSVSQYVRAFSPATVARYERAWADLTAAIGRVLMPVMDGAIKVVRYFGDTIAGLQPVFGPLVRDIVTALTPTFEQVGRVFREVVGVAAAVYQAFHPLVSVVAGVLNPLRTFTLAMKLLADILKAVTIGLTMLFGLKMPKFEGASQGLAYVNTQTTTTSAMMQAIRERAFQLGGEKGPDKDQQQINLLDMIAKGIANLPQMLADKFRLAMIDAMTKMLPEIAKLIPPVPGLPNPFGKPPAKPGGRQPGPLDWIPGGNPFPFGG